MSYLYHYGKIRSGIHSFKMSLRKSVTCWIPDIKAMKIELQLAKVGAIMGVKLIHSGGII